MRKKIIIIVVSLLLLTGVAGTFWGPSIAQAASSIWNSCPKGKVNDAYPGDCRDYIDTNSDGICDRSQSAPQTAASIPASTVDIPADSSITNPVSDDPSTNDSNITMADSSTYTETEDAALTGNGDSYYFLPVLATLVILYSLTWILSAKKVFRTLTHRKIWNIVLLVASLVSILLGIILILNIDLDTNIRLPFDMLFWHVEAGLALGVIAIFHITWHWRYFVKSLRT